MRNKILAIIILNYNNSNDTIECLKSLSNNVISQLYKVFLIDNSNEKCTELDHFLKNTNIDLDYFFLGRNSGFTEGNNIGILKALNEKFSQVLLLNNDTVVIDDSIEKASNLLQSNDNIDIGGLVNYYYSDKTKIWQYGKKIYIRFGTIVENKFDQQRQFSICDYVPGSSIIIKSKVFEKIGLLDENFFAYFEEIDLCIRAKKENFKIAYLPQSKILHKVGESTINKKKLYLKTRNSLYFYSKHLPKWNFVMLSPKIILKQIIKAIIHKGTFNNINAVWIGFKDFKTANFKMGSMKFL